MSLVVETWLPVAGFEDRYEISDLGRIRRSNLSENLLKGWTGKDGHLLVKLGRGPDRKNYYIHRLVLLSFVGPAPLDMECRHLDGNPQNNVLGNLCWGTRQQNIDDQKRHRGQPGRKLSVADIHLMRDRFKQARPMKEIAREFGVSLSVPYHIRQGRKYADV